MRWFVNKISAAKFKIILAMVIFGTIGVFVKYIFLPSSVIAVSRGFLGAFYIFVSLIAAGKKIDFDSIRKNILHLAVTGGFIGINWILLFEAYRYIGVANATLCYYFEPVILVVGAAVIYREKIKPIKGLCILTGLVGMVFVSGVFPPGGAVALDTRGVLSGLGAALFYALVILINRNMGEISCYDMTMVQLFFASAVTLPYVLLTEDITALKTDAPGMILLVVLGIVHTGTAYVLYFESVRYLKSQTVALLSYIDPMVAIVLSMTPLLGEQMTFWGVMGAVMIFGSTLAASKE